MASLISFGITSLDGYIADRDGNFDWSMPDEEVHSFVNDFQRPIGTYLYGRRLYDVMAGWETMPEDNAITADFAAQWRAADKIVYSTTLDSVSTSRTRLERQFDPTAVRALKDSADTDISIGGSALAGQALRAGLVDEVHQLISPVVIGGGTSFLPDIRLNLELLDQRRFGNGVVYVRYRVIPAATA